MLVFRLLVISGCAASVAYAQTPRASFRYQVNSGSGWTSSVNVPAGTAVDVREFIDWQGPAVGLGDAFMNIRIDGANAHLDSAVISDDGYGRQAPFASGAQNLAVFSNVTNRLRIDVAGDTSNSTGGQIWISQKAPYFVGTNVNTDRSALVFQFRYQLSSTNSQLRPLKIYTGNLRRNEVRLFSSMTSTAPDLAVPLSYAEIEGQSATINVVPSPGSVVLLGTSAVVWVSRRRRPDASITSAQRV